MNRHVAKQIWSQLFNKLCKKKPTSHAMSKLWLIVFMAPMDTIKHSHQHQLKIYQMGNTTIRPFPPIC